MTYFTGIWQSDFQHWTFQMAHRPRSDLRADADDDTPSLQIDCVFVGTSRVIFRGTDVSHLDIGPDDDHTQFCEEEIEMGFSSRYEDVPRWYEYRIADGSLFMKSLDMAGAGWKHMPFRHESSKAFLIRPGDFYLRMLPMTIEQLDEDCCDIALVFRGWIEEATREGLSFSAEHRIPTSLVNSPDDATGFDPTL